MTDLFEALPDFNVKPYSHLIHSLEKAEVTVADLLSLDPVEIARTCPLPLRDVRALVADVVEAMQKDVGIGTLHTSTSSVLQATDPSMEADSKHFDVLGALRIPSIIRTLDPTIDEALGGGIHTGYLTEIAGESSAGKTQLALGLLLSVQLPPPQGISRNAIYVSTESFLNTTRLTQMLAAHPIYTDLPNSHRPTMDKVWSISVNDLETQDRVIEFQLPRAVRKYNAGLVIVDSVAANYRAEYETRTAESLAMRASDLAKLGRMLRDVAVEHDVAVVVTNQVADRFDDPLSRMSQDLLRSSSPATSSSPTPQSANPARPPAGSAVASAITRRDEVLSLDHQQRFFTGWGDGPNAVYEDMKTPALGLAWANQISARIVLKVEDERTSQRPEDYLGGHIWRNRKRRRFMKVVFAPWVEPTEKPVEYEIKMEGIRAVMDLRDDLQAESAELLDERLWKSGGENDDEEFP